MQNFLQLLLTGLSIGASYALVALGFVLIYRAANVVNFAQGQLAMVGGYLMLVLAVDMHVAIWAAFVLTMAGMAIFGVIYELGVYYPLRNQSFLPVVISTVAASILLQNLSQFIFGAVPMNLPTLFTTPTVKVGGIILSVQYLAILGITALFVMFQYLVLDRSLLGKKMQATAQDKDMARLLGIPVALTIAFTFIYASILGGAAGVLVAPIFFLAPSLGGTIALKAFCSSIVGGFGNTVGAIIGGLAIGVIETFGAAYISEPYKDAYAFIVLILFLLIRPQGIFGEKIAEKA